MSKYNEISLENIKRYSFEDRKNKVSVKDFVNINKKINNINDSIFPDILMGKNIKDFVEKCIKAIQNKKPIILMMGAHIIKCGLSKLIIKMMEDGIISCIVMNGACSIHDFEIAIFGETSEDVAENLANGTFGMVKETGKTISEILKSGFENNLGYGEAIGKYICENNAKYFEYSIFGNAYKLDIPVTVHSAIGTDIIFQHKEMSGKAIGECSYRDFLILANVLKDINDEGIVILFGSAVILPEVFLKALTVARNLGNEVANFSTAVFDMIRHYRPQFNVVSRPTSKSDSGKGYYFIGHHEIMFPLFYHLLVDRLNNQ